MFIFITSFFVTPIIRAKLNHQFMLGARNQAFLTEYVSGMETVKSLQMEPQLKQTFGNYLRVYLKINRGLSPIVIQQQKQQDSQTQVQAASKF